MTLGRRRMMQPPPAVRRRPARVWLLVLVALLALAGGVIVGIALVRSGRLAGPQTAGAAATQPAGSGGEEKQLWTCGMHPQVILDHPGECPICHMKLTPLKKEDQAKTAAKQGPQQRKILYWRAPMDPTYISDKPGKSPMGMDLVPVYADEVSVGPTVRIDPVTRQNMGIRTIRVRRGPLVKTIRTLGRVDYDERRVTYVDMKYDGWIEKLIVDQTGVPVRRGEPLFEIYSPKLYQSQEELVAALRGRERLRETPLPEARAEAQRLVDDAIKQLRYLDLTEAQIEEIRRTRRSRKSLAYYSPATGIVVNKHAQEGMYVKPGMRLYTIADLSHVWVYVDIYEYQLPWVRIGQKATMTLPYIPGKQYEGRVTYIYPYLEKQTRTIKVRLEFANPGIELKPDMYATVVLHAVLDRQALLIPREAYIDSGRRRIAFVDLDDGKFEPRDIQVGVETEEGWVEVRYGLDEGERVVISGQFLLDAESKLREAVQKMLEPGKIETTPAALPGGSESRPGAASAPATQPAQPGGIPPDAKYACPMETHPDAEDPADRGPYFSREPGRCPICGMRLKPIDQLDWVKARKAAGGSPIGYSCPEHPHVLATEPGSCPRCGRALAPFKMMFTCPNPEHADVISPQPGYCPRDHRALVPYRGVWLSPELAAQNIPPNPESAARARYHCPLHPLVHSDRPARCTICGRALVPQTPATRPAPPAAGGPYVCPMHPDERSDDPQARCPICGMQLVPQAALPRPTTVPAALRTAVNFAMEHYLQIQRLLAADTTEGLDRQARGLAEAADRLLADLRRHPDEAPDQVRAATQELLAAAQRLSGQPLDEARVTFVRIGAAMEQLVDHIRPDRQRFETIYIFHCPMTKGDWLQTTPEMKNPFYGRAMLKCGELKSRR